MSEPIALPSGAGISGDAVASSLTVATSSLVVDDGPTGSLPTAPVLTVIVSTTSSQNSPTPSATDSAVSSSSSNSISLSTVVGSCVGAFIGVSALIILGIWFYRHYSESLNKLAKQRALERKRRRPWNKLEEGQDKWEDRHQTKEVDQVVPMEKLTMFKRGASVRTANTQKSVDDAPLTYPPSFAPFDTNLVRTLTADNSTVSQPRPSRDAKPPSSLSPSSNSFGGPLAPSNMAIPTPEATVHQSHKWESAEVVHYTEDQPAAQVVEPLAQDKNARSMHNPFFGSQEYSRSRSNSAVNEKSPNAKGKERMHDSMLSSDPFEEFTQLPKPTFIHHQATDSSTSTQSKERALQTLMGALELSEDEVRERLRVASMQPSVISQTSQISTTVDEQEFANNVHLLPRDGKSGNS